MAIITALSYNVVTAVCHRPAALSTMAQFSVLMLASLFWLLPCNLEVLIVISIVILAVVSLVLYCYSAPRL